MDVKKFVAFILLVVLTLGAAGATTPYFLNKVRLGLDLKGGFEILYVASPIEAGGKVDKDSLNQTAQALEKRVNAQGVSEPEITTEGQDRIRVRIAGVADQDKLRDILKKPADLTFRGPDGTVYLRGGDFVPGGAKVEYENGSIPIVSIKLVDKNKMKEVTTKLLNKTLAIYLDDKMVSDPSVNQVIDSDSAVITGGPFSFDEANNLKNTINLGALPLKLTEKYTQSVGATLGQQSLHETVYAGVIALGLIMLFVLFFYRLPGLVACVTLMIYTWLLFVVFDLMNAVLTLPGIAAFVLGIGMAVDANIITDERIKEELRSGKAITSSLKAGSRNSFRTIIDAHVTTILAGIVLYFIGTGAIQGFALTLIFSLLVNILTNVFFSRLLLHLVIRSGVFTKPWYFGVKESEINAHL